MKTIVNYITTCITASCLAFICFSCNSNTGPANGLKDSVNSKGITKTLPKKPPSGFADTLVIHVPAAVFYQPDSLQLSSMKAITDSMIFDGTMHEYFYQMRNARMVIKKYWPGIKIIEAAKFRYLLFVKKDKSTACIDLDTRKDSHGLFLFDTVKAPEAVDMMNIESFMGFYFSGK